MSLVGQVERNGTPEENRFLIMLMVSVCAHVGLVLFVTFFSGFLPQARINVLPSYTPVSVVSMGDVGKTPTRQVQVKKATKQIAAKKPSLIQEKTDLKKLEASKLSIEKKGLKPEKVSPEPQKPARSSSEEPGSSPETEAPETAPPNEAQGAGSFAVQGVSGSAGGTDNPELTVYTSIILDRISEAWFLPPSLKREAAKQNLVMVVGIRIDRSGSVTLQGVEQGSGNSLFDNYALAAIKKVQAESFPPLPEVYRGPHLDLGIRFRPSEVGS